MNEQLPDWERERFDRLLDRVMLSLPARLHELLDEAPLIVDDAPTGELLEEMGLDPGLDDLCGLYSGIPLTERGHDASGADGGAFGGDDEVMRQIRITILHEIGHHFGLSEDDLSALGYE